MKIKESEIPTTNIGDGSNFAIDKDNPPMDKKKKFLLLKKLKKSLITRT